jgi:hypothetical protein
MRVLGFDEFEATVKDELGTSSVLATILAADRDSPSINLRVFPMPASGPGSLWLDYWIALAQFGSVSDTVDLPTGYEDALHFNLALRLYPQYGRPGGIDPVLAANAQISKAALVDLNSQIIGRPAAPPAAAPQAPPAS